MLWQQDTYYYSLGLEMWKRLFQFGLMSKIQKHEWVKEEALICTWKEETRRRVDGSSCGVMVKETQVTQVGSIDEQWQL